MLIAHNQAAFDSTDYIYELKLDGIRCLAYLWDDGMELRNKRNKRLNPIYPELSGINKQAKKRCILDGELVVLKNGIPDFFEMQKRSLMSNQMKIKLAAQKLPVCFTAFDILYVDQKPVTDLQLLERKALLTKTINESERLAVSRYIEDDGKAFYKAAAQMGLEGIVAKRKDSKYYFGKRTNDWIKMKALIDEDFIVCGYFLKAVNIASVILGLYDNKSIVYQGHVVMGVSRHDFKKMQMVQKVDKDYYPAFSDFDDAVWLAPKLVCTVQYMDRTPSGGLRQPVFKGVRDDKNPEECILGRS